MSEDLSLDFASVCARYRSGRSTPSALMRAVLARAATGDARAVWIHRVGEAEVMARAAHIERRAAADGLDAMPLYGLPFAVKDNIDVASHPTTAACPDFAYVPACSATVVKRLEDAGAILIGKTNLDQFATGLVGTRSPYGACTNAFDARYIAGGSSSGSAVAVATGLVSFALGTDTAGSGRVPAAFNNIIGLKPTRGLISMAGVVPACRTLDCVSVFALSCGDAHAVFKAARGVDARDSFSRAMPAVAPQRMPAAPFRFALPSARDLEFFGDAHAAGAFAGARTLLEGIGGTSIEIDFAPFRETAALLYQGPWVAERLAAIKTFFSTHPDSLHEVTRRVIAQAQNYSAIDAFEAMYRLQDLKLRCDDVWQHAEVLVVPTAGTIYRVEQVASDPVELNTNLGYYMNFVNLLDLCAVAVPTGFRADGLPAGVTLNAPAFNDSALCDLGHELHAAARVPMGATKFPLPATSAATARSAGSDTVTLAVAGAHLSGLPLNHEIVSRGARLIGAARTTTRYRLYALPSTTPPKPGLVGVADGAAIEVELWQMPVAGFGSLVAGIPAPLGIGTITLEDGREVKGFLCESHATSGARDISSFGGWRNFLASASTPS